MISYTTAARWLGRDSDLAVTIMLDAEMKDNRVRYCSRELTILSFISPATAHDYVHNDYGLFYFLIVVQTDYLLVSH